MPTIVIGSSETYEWPASMSLSNSGQPFDKIRVSASKHSGGLCVCVCVGVCLLWQVAGLSEEVLLQFLVNYQHAQGNTCPCINVAYCRKQHRNAKTTKAARCLNVVEGYEPAAEGRLKQRRNSTAVKLSQFYIWFYWASLCLFYTYFQFTHLCKSYFVP